MKLPKVRLGDRVRHATRPDLGEGEVWELRANGYVSVVWDALKTGWMGRAWADPHINFRHYHRASLVLLKKKGA